MYNMTQPKLYSRGGKLWIRFYLDSKQIRKPLNLDDTKANKKLAEVQLIPQMIINIHSGEFFKKEIVKTVPTIDEYVQKSFDLHRGNRCSSTIYSHYKNYDKYIKEKFGSMKLDELKADMVTLWQNDLQEKELLAKATILKIRSILYTMYEDAVENDIVLRNPIKRAKKMKRSEKTKVKRLKLQPFSLQEIADILNAVDGQKRNIIATLFYTGLRGGELIGLKWKDIDFSKKTIAIRQQVVNGVEKELLKTARSQRTVPIIKALLPYLKSQYEITANQNSFVFITEKSNRHFFNTGKLREQIWVKALKAANVEYRNLHQTRGTFISTLISSGEDINFVSKIVGHENVKITLERYSEYIPMQNKKFGKCFN